MWAVLDSMMGLRREPEWPQSELGMAACLAPFGGPQPPSWRESGQLFFPSLCISLPACRLLLPPAESSPASGVGKEDPVASLGPVSGALSAVACISPHGGLGRAGTFLGCRQTCSLCSILQGQRPDSGLPLHCDICANQKKVTSLSRANRCAPWCVMCKLPTSCWSCVDSALTREAT